MNWLSSNWIWLALGAGALLLFTSGRGGCGMGHGGHDHHRREEADQNGRSRDTTAAPLSTPVARLDSQDNASPATSHVHDAPSINQGAFADEHAGHNAGASQTQRQPHRHGC